MGARTYITEADLRPEFVARITRLEQIVLRLFPRPESLQDLPDDEFLNMMAGDVRVEAEDEYIMKKGAPNWPIREEFARRVPRLEQAYAVVLGAEADE